MQVREKGREVKAYKHTPCSEHFWKLRCRKSARRCGAKHVSKSKCAKHHVRSTVGNRDVEIVHAVLARSKFPSLNVQNTSCSEHLGSVEKVHAVVARSTFPSQNVKKATCSDHFWTFRCRFAWPAQSILHRVKREQNPEQNVGVLWQLRLQPPIHYTTFHSTTTTTTTE